MLAQLRSIFWEADIGILLQNICWEVTRPLTWAAGFWVMLIMWSCRNNTTVQFAVYNTVWRGDTLKSEREIENIESTVTVHLSGTLFSAMFIVIADFSTESITPLPQ